MQQKVARIFLEITYMRFLLAFLITFSSSIAVCQQQQLNVTGSWFGTADALMQGTHNNYMVELTIKQKGNDIEGVLGYYFRDGYQSYFVRGKFNESTRMITIKNLPITYFRGKNVDGVDCYMNFEALFMASRVKSTLRGTFIPDNRYKYTCPELRIIYQLDSIIKHPDSASAQRSKNAAIKKYWQPGKEDLVITPEVKKPQPVSADTIVNNMPPINKEVFKQMVMKFEQRKNVLQQEIEIESDSVRVSFYDNGDIDGDSIAVFLNKVPVLTHQLLSTRSLNMYLAFNEKRPTTDISMFAENLGSIPPNTALMVVTDGEKTHQVYMSSTLTQNATIRLKKRKKT
jgi:hypothetical protein